MVVDGLSEAEADRVFHAMADKTRRDILARVVLHEQSVSSLSRQYEMSFAAVQKHVAVLEHAELVGKHRQGREQIVRANTSTLRRAVELLDSYEQLWVQRAKQITELLTSEKGEADDRHPL
jgi:DNA-binding transcriptional ArsR family regulator